MHMHFSEEEPEEPLVVRDHLYAMVDHYEEVGDKLHSRVFFLDAIGADDFDQFHPGGHSSAQVSMRWQQYWKDLRAHINVDNIFKNLKLYRIEITFSEAHGNYKRLHVPVIFVQIFNDWPTPELSHTENPHISSSLLSQLF